ncbi:hypothetical protein D3C80_1744620 [compost metagenome]
MTGIDAHAHARFIFHAIDNCCQMFKFETQITALPGGVFDNCRDAFRLCQRNVDGFRNACQTGVFIDLHQMAARMEIQQRQAKLFATL